MVLTKTAENYLKQIWLAEQRGKCSIVSMGEVASEVGVVPGTATTMVKSLADAALVRYEPRQGVRLTKKGQLAAAGVIRRHRLIESFLVEVVGMPWSEVHAEAEELEHAVSDRLLGYLDRLLGNPTSDPHGDPIPDTKGKIQPFRHSSLADATEGETKKIARLMDQSAEFLAFADREKLIPGREVRIRRRDPMAGLMDLSLEDNRGITLSTQTASKIHVW